MQLHCCWHAAALIHLDAFNHSKGKPYIFNELSDIGSVVSFMLPVVLLPIHLYSFISSVDQFWRQNNWHTWCLNQKCNKCGKSFCCYGPFIQYACYSSISAILIWHLNLQSYTFTTTTPSPLNTEIDHYTSTYFGSIPHYSSHICSTTWLTKKFRLLDIDRSTMRLCKDIVCTIKIQVKIVNLSLYKSQCVWTVRTQPQSILFMRIIHWYSFIVILMRSIKLELTISSTLILGTSHSVNNWWNHQWST